MSIDLSLSPGMQKLLIGHAEALQRLNQQQEQGRLHPAWLLSGQKGIGKATLAYRFARHLLANSQDNAVFYNSLIDQRAHPNLFVLERSVDEDGKLETDIKIDKVRGLTNFARQSPAIPGWRVVIIDAIDELNRNAANSILKLLEEPPQQLVFLMVCHSLGNILPTIRSRCCVLPIHPLTEAEFSQLGIQQTSPLLSELAGGSIGGYMSLTNMDVVSLLSQLIDITADVCQNKMHTMTGFCSTLEKKEPRVEKIPELLFWLSRQLVLCSSGVSIENELKDKIVKLSGITNPNHWLMVNQTISNFLNLAKGAHPDPLHLIQALFLLMNSPQSYQS